MQVKVFKYVAAATLALGGMIGAQSAGATPVTFETLTFTNDGLPSEILGTLTCDACSALVFRGAGGDESVGPAGSFVLDGSAGEFFDLSDPFFSALDDPLADLGAAADFANANLGTNIGIESAVTVSGSNGTTTDADAVLLSVGGGTPLYALLRNDNAPVGGGFTFSWMGNAALADSGRSVLNSFTQLNVTDLPTTTPIQTVTTDTGGSQGGSQGGDQGGTQGGNQGVSIADNAAISPVPLPLSGLLLLGGLGGLALVRRKSA